jgi:tryptophanyl-tRNA synthetase
MFGELSRMTQFKDKSAKNADNINAGLFTYPVLMAADILLYQTDLVPVGIDQKQHIEITRDIAQRFNSVYSETFTVPDEYIPPVGMKIMSLTDPTKKMSKSDENPAAVVNILDSKDDIIRKFRRAVTDSDTQIKQAPGKDGINNLINIYGCITGESTEEIERKFTGVGYGEFKTAVGEACAEALAPIKDKFSSLMANKTYIEEIMRSGAQQASYSAMKTLCKVKRKVGFVI